MFSRNGCMVHLLYSQVAIEYDKHNSRDSNQILLTDKDLQVMMVSCALGQSLHLSFHCSHHHFFLHIMPPAYSHCNLSHFCTFKAVQSVM